MSKFIYAAIVAALILSCNKTMNNPLLVKSTNQYEAPAFDKIKSENYLPAFREAIKEADKEITAIADNKAQPSFQNTIVALSLAGETLNRVSGLFFNILEANTDTILQRAAEEISPELTKHSLSILFNEKLFQRVKNVYDKRDELKLNQEDAKLLKETYKSFADNGANLSKEDKVKFQKVQEELNLATLKFGDNVLAATNAFTLTVTDSSDLAGLPKYVIDAAEAEAKQKKLIGWVFTLQYPSYGPFMQFSAKRELREKMWVAYNTKCIGGDFDNRDLIKKIVALRIQEAKLLGYKSYAEYALIDRMAKNPENVNTFLQDLLQKSVPYAQRDLKEIREYAKKTGLKEELMPWDFSYYSEKLKKEKYSLDDEMLKPYFKLENVKQAVFALADSLYGLKFIEATNIPVYQKDVKVYVVKETGGKEMALLYMDFFPRESKRGGAWMTSFREEYTNSKGKEMRPLISMVMNFSKPTEKEPSLLTFDEVTTLLHEFGHALHGILAEGKYTSLTGTNVARDFVELPSQIMENWATEPAYLATFAKHYKTGEIIPKEMIDKIVAAKNYLNGYYSMRQLAFGINDMAWHNLISVPENLDVIKFEKEATYSCNLLPATTKSAFSPSFTHIFSGGYAAGYYSYKWAEVLEADAFQLFKEKGIFNKEVAESFRKNILSRGSIEDADILYRNFRGRDPKPDALIEKLK
jgi:peptidyl-dipeptidase Dcp